MKNHRIRNTINVWLSTLAFLLAGAWQVDGATRTASVTGNWNSTATWGGQAVPTSADDVTINNAITVTINIPNAVCNSITTVNRGGIVISGNNSLTVSGLVSMARPSSNNTNFTVNVGAGTLTCGSLTMNATTTSRNNIVTISTGTVTINGTVTTGTTGCQFNFTDNGLLVFKGSFAGGPAAVTPSSGTIEYASNSPAIQAFSGSYNNLVYSGSGTTTGSTSGTITVNGNLSANGGGTFDFSSRPVVLTGTNAIQSIAGFTTTGTVSLTKTAGIATFQGNVNAGALTINGNGGTLNLGSDHTHTFTGNWTRTAGTLNGGSSTLKIGGSVGGTGGGAFVAGSGTVEWYRAGTQTCAVLTYNNLTLSGTSAKTFTTAPTVNGTLSLEGTASVTVTTGAVVYGPNATLQYNKPTSYTATTEEWPATFSASGGVVITNTGTISFSATKNVTGSIAISAGSSANLGAITTHTAGSLILNGTAQVCGTWGHPSSIAENPNNIYFANTTGYLTVGTMPNPYTITGGGSYCAGGSGVAVGLSGSEAGVNYQLLVGGTPVGGAVAGTGSTISFGIQTTAGNYTVEATRSIGNCTATMTGSVDVAVRPLPVTPVIESITQPTCDESTGSISLSGLPSAGIWILRRQPDNITSYGTGSTTTINGLSSGTYQFSIASEKLDANCPGSGDGLKAEYFDNRTLSGTPVLTRTDAWVNFNWGNGGPGSPIGPDNFSVRWSGRIQPCYSETYTFVTQSDDGIRLWINGTQIINNWDDHASETDNSTGIYLAAGQKYDIVLEFYENGGEAVAQLSWRSASQTQQIVPQSQLFSNIISDCESDFSAEAIIITQPTTPSAPVISFPASAASVCNGSSINLSAVSSGNTIYWYTTATGGTPIGTSASGASFEVFPNDGSVYYAESQSSFGCISPTRSATGTITLTSPSTAPTSVSGATTICSGNSTTLTLNGGSLGTGASWKWYSGNCGETVAGTGTSINVSPTSTTSYFVRAEGDCNVTGCATIVVTVNPQIVTNLIQPE